jgi:hypothetical protein
MRRLTVYVLIALFVVPSLANAQSAPSRSRHTPAWIAVGVGTGFGLGLWAGLSAFDQSINSDRKVWTTVVVSAAAGGLLGYLLTRSKKQRPAPVAPVAPVGPVAPVAPAAPFVYSLRSPASGDSRDARAAGK